MNKDCAAGSVDCLLVAAAAVKVDAEDVLLMQVIAGLVVDLVLVAVAVVAKPSFAVSFVVAEIIKFTHVRQS